MYTCSLEGNQNQESVNLSVCGHMNAGLPVEQEVVAEAEEVLQKLQSLLPQLQRAAGLQGHSWQGQGQGQGQGPQLFKAHAALLWAMCCMERCSRCDPDGTGTLLAPAIAALPQVQTGKPVCTHRLVDTAVVQQLLINTLQGLYSKLHCMHLSSAGKASMQPTNRHTLAYS